MPTAGHVTDVERQLIPQLVSVYHFTAGELFYNYYKNTEWNQATLGHLQHAYCIKHLQKC